MKTRILALLLALSLLTGMTATVSAADSGMPFTDVVAGAWYEEAVRFCYENGLTNGMSATTFSPSGTMTRAMLATMLWRMEGSEKPAAASGFRDVPAGKWYSDAVAWAKETGIVNGMSDTEFAPDKAVTREQIVKMLYGYSQYKGYETPDTITLNGFPDRNNVRSYAVTPLRWAVTTGVINGVKTKVLWNEQTFYLSGDPMWDDDLKAGLKEGLYVYDGNGGYVLRSYFDQPCLNASDPATRAQVCSMVMNLSRLQDNAPANDPTPAKETFVPTFEDLDGYIESEVDLANICKWVNCYIEDHFVLNPDAGSWAGEANFNFKKLAEHKANSQEEFEYFASEKEDIYYGYVSTVDQMANNPDEYGWFGVTYAYCCYEPWRLKDDIEWGEAVINKATMSPEEYEAWAAQEREYHAGSFDLFLKH